MDVAGWLLLPVAYEWICHQFPHAFCDSFEIRSPVGVCCKNLLDVVNKDSDGILLVHLFLSFDGAVFLKISKHPYSTIKLLCGIVPPHLSAWHTAPEIQGQIGAAEPFVRRPGHSGDAPIKGSHDFAITNVEAHSSVIYNCRMPAGTGHRYWSEPDQGVHGLRDLGTGLPTEPLETIQKAITYLENQRPWIGSYEHWRKLGYPVGSGMIERAVALVINRRMKKRGMRWCRPNATAIVALQTDLLNDDWILPQRLRSFP